MCAKELNNRIMCKKHPCDLGMWEFCINTHTHTHTHCLYKEGTQGNALR